MSVSGIGSGAAKEYSALYYSNQVAASRHRAGEVKTSAKADNVVKTRQREQDVPVYSERASQAAACRSRTAQQHFPCHLLLRNMKNIRRPLMSITQK